MEVILLNRDYSILSIISPKSAVSKIAVDERKLPKERKYEILQAYDKKFGNYQIPRIMRLLKSVEIIHKRKQPWSKTSLFLRDSFTCQYCGIKLSGKELEVEHVVPRCQGGKTLWENTVASCRACNQKKANKTPQQANMKIRKRPYQPSIADFLSMKIRSNGHEEILNEIFK